MSAKRVGEMILDGMMAVVGKRIHGVHYQVRISRNVNVYSFLSHFIDRLLLVCLKCFEAAYSCSVGCCVYVCI